MISGTFNITLLVSICINTVLINNNIGNDKNANKNKRKNYNLAMGKQKTIETGAKKL